MAKAVRMDYDAPSAYQRLIAPRYAPIADALVAAAGLRPGEHVLELGAGTGLVSSRAAAAIAPDGGLVVTDLSAPMLEVARESVDGPAVTFALVDYGAPLPLLDPKIDDTSAHTVTVDNAASCADDPYDGDGASFSDTPLTKIQVIVTSQAGAGVTSSSITCDSGSADSENGDPDPDFDDKNESYSDLPPGTYNCQ